VVRAMSAGRREPKVCALTWDKSGVNQAENPCRMALRTAEGVPLELRELEISRSN